MEPNSVEIFQENEKIVVRLVEGGERTDNRFQHADFAHSWAAGQRVRLTVPSPTVIVD